MNPSPAGSFPPMQTHRSFRRILTVAAAITLIGAGAAFSAASFDASPASATTYVPTLTTWNTPTSGTLGSATVTATTNTPSTSTWDLSDPAQFNPAGPAATPMLQFAAPDAVSFALTSTVANPVLYFRYMRGPGIGGPATMTLSSSGGACTWSIRSGFTGATLNGAVLTLPNAFVNGIIECTGTPSSIGWTPAGGNTGGSGSLVTLGFLTDVTPTTSSSSSTTVAAVAAEDPVIPTFTG